jgi:hypothetical protein
VKRSYLLAALFLSSLSIGACSQDPGDTCQIDGDCTSGYMCCRSAASPRGTCEKASDCNNAAVVDSGTAGDSGSMSTAGSGGTGDDAGANRSMDDAGGDAG